MKIKRKLSMIFFTLFSILIALTFPAVYIYYRVMQDNLDVIPQLNIPFLIYAGIAVILTGLGYVYTKWFKKIWNRKLQAIATVKEFEMIPDTAPLLTRCLRSLEYSYPLITLLFLFKGLTFISPSFFVLKSILIWINVGMLAMAIILLIRDIIDNHYRNEIRISTQEKDELKVEKKYLHRLEKGMSKDGEVSKKNKKLLEIKQRIQEIEEQNT